MNDKIHNRLKKVWLTLIFMMTTSMVVNAQIGDPEDPIDGGDTFEFSISGPTQVTSGVIYTYAISGSATGLQSVTWDVSTKGTIVSESTTTLQIRWEVDGPGYISAIIVPDNSFNFYFSDLFITITLPPPPPPPTIYTWYPDSDGDGFGDVNVAGIENIASSFPGHSRNNYDNCPDVYSTVNNGCPAGYTRENINYITTTGYDVNGEVRLRTKSYFDVLGKNIQDQSWDSNTGKVWASQVLYDAQGRPALNSLNAPIGNNFRYRPDLMINPETGIYGASDFESDFENPSKVNGDFANTLGWYYSESNDSVPYQDVTDYPFARTVYSTLNPGTPLRILGGNKINGEWPQGYSFSMPASVELAQTVAFNSSKYNTIEVIKTIDRDVHGVENVVFTDTDGRILATARSGGASSRDMNIVISEQGFVDIHVPSGRGMGFSVNAPPGITLTIHDLISESQVVASVLMPNGFYRVSINELENYDSEVNPVTINYKENYYDYSLNNYDQAGRLLSSKQPLNHLESTFEYDALGQLIHTKSPDEGESWFKYRKDGQIRYSQNSKQLAVGEFSYTDYDDYGRPIESGVIVNPSTFANIDPDGNFSFNTKKEQQFTIYDQVYDEDLYSVLIASNIPTSYSKDQTFVTGNVSKTYTLNPNTATTWYSYDAYGRIKWLVQKIEGLGTKTIDYEYDPITGSVTKVDFQRHIPSERFVHRYTYDIQDNNLVRVETSIDNENYTVHADYKYYETGALKRKELGGGIQGMDYVYNLNGQLKSINHPSLNAIDDPGRDTNDLFGMQIDYHSADYKRAVDNIKATSYGTDQLNGNIKGVRWNNDYLTQTQPQAQQHTYAYQYDRNNWLTDAHFGQYSTPSGTNAPENVSKNSVFSGTETFEATNQILLLPGFHGQQGSDISGKIVNVGGFQENTNGDYNVTGITYDANGNIQTLNRNKNTKNGSNLMDALSYTYKTDRPNQLLRVDDAVTSNTNTDDIKDQEGDNYVYNEIGQLVANTEEGISYLYNASGLVTEIKKNGEPLIKLFYNDRNHRIKKESYNTAGVLQNSTFYIRDASGTALAIFQNNTITEHTIYGTDRLGVFYRQGNSSVYQLTDHLGNVRAVVGTTGISGASDYYPFGMLMPNRNLSGAEGYRYAYQGQEKDSETGKEAFELRLWDSRIGRWLTTDPAGQYFSPYMGMGNNPISRVDPDGGMDCPNPPCSKLPLGATPLIGEGGFIAENISPIILDEVVVTAAPVSTAGAPKLIPYAPMKPIRSPQAPKGTGTQVHPLLQALAVGNFIINTFSSFDNPLYDAPESDYDRPEDDDLLYLYRAMRIQNGMPEIGDNSLAQLGVRDADLIPKGRNTPVLRVFPGDLVGMSVTPWNPSLTYPPPTPNKPLWRIHISKLSTFNLQFFQDEVSHGIIIPIHHVDVNTFRANVHKTAVHWELVK